MLAVLVVPGGCVPGCLVEGGGLGPRLGVIGFGAEGVWNGGPVYSKDLLCYPVIKKDSSNIAKARRGNGLLCSRILVTTRVLHWPSFI